jgi:putative nucleotidyltransferase with HDIG domain
MNRRAHTYIAAVSVAAGLLLAALPDVPRDRISARELIGIACFLGVGILAEAMAINFRLGAGKQAKSSLAFLPFLACAALFEPLVAVSIVGFVVAVSQFGLRQHDWARGAFNVSQGIISVGLSALAYLPFAPESVGAQRPTLHLVGFVVLATIFFATNILLNSGALALIKQLPLGTVLGQIAGTKGSNLWYDLLATPVAILTAQLYISHDVGGLLMVILPLLLIRHSYKDKIRVDEANKDLLFVLVKAIETRDPYTSGHSVRVATLAKMIAQDMSLSIRQVADVEAAALLHDIGKIDSIYEVVIRKPYELSAAERDLIKTHATKGADLLESLSTVSRDVIKAVRHHHERYDGTGYPAGLGRDEIPVASRIIMLCDSIDAMLSDRPYRKALSIEKTRLELVRCASTQFDPDIVRVILQQNTLERAARLVTRISHNTVDEPMLVASA